MRLLLFLGAGVSKPSGLPIAAPLTQKLFESRPGEDPSAPRIRALLAVIQAYDTADIAKVGLMPRAGGFESSGAIYRGPQSTYEDLYFLCQQILMWNIGLSDNSLATPFMERIEAEAGDILQGDGVAARMCDLGSMGRLMCSYISAVVAEELRHPYRTGFDLIGELIDNPGIERLDIVTLNHDTLVEQFLSARGIPFVDGFGAPDGDVRWADDGVYDAPVVRVRIFKLHGSIDWYSFRTASGTRPAIFSGQDVATAKDGAGNGLRAEYQAPSFISGINKADAYQRGIYADIHFRFSQLLRQTGPMLMSGYGWGDTAINFRLDNWFDRSRDNKFVLLDENPEGLMDRSMLFASGFHGWLRSGRLTCVRKYLCGVTLSDLPPAILRGT
jgi:hypothetical protein